MGVHTYRYCPDVQRNGLTSRRAASSTRATFKVECAISREKKEKIVAVAKERLENSALVFAMRMNGLSVHQVESFRRSLPKGQASVYVCKNTLLNVAIDQTEGWEAFKPVSRNENAFVFASEEAIAITVQKWIDFERRETNIRRANAAEDEEVARVSEIYGGAFQGKRCTPEEVLKLKNLPTKKEAVASIAGMLNSVSAGFVATLNQVPVSLAANMEQIADLDEDKTRTVRDFLKTASADEAPSS